MKIITIQNKSILETLKNNQTHYAKSTNISNLKDPYDRMMKHYGWKHSPVFGCAAGRYSEFCGAAREDVVILTLDVPNEMVKLQTYYDWSDVIYFIEYPNDWYSAVISLDEYIKQTLDGHGTDDPNAIIQAAIPYIKPEWFVDYKELDDKFLDKYYSSGGTNILEGE